MAGYRAIAAVGRSIVDLLNRRFEQELPAGQRPRAVLAGANDFEKVESSPTAVIRYPAISLYFYRVVVDRETRPGWSTVASIDGVPRIPLRLHFLLAAWDSVVENELEYLGMALRILESEPVLTGPLLHHSGDWDPADVIQVVADDLGQDSMSEAFQALTTQYRLSFPYVARVVCIDGRSGSTVERVAAVASGTEVIE